MSEDNKEENKAEKKEAPPEEQKKDEPQVNKFEEAAKAKGWKPKEEYEGIQESWIGAEEFLKREPLFDRIKQSSKEVKELKKTIESMATYHKRAVEAEVAKRISDLKSQKKEAIQTGDVDKVEEIDKAIDEQKQIKADIPTKKEAPPEIVEWVGKNPWFDTDKEMADFAVAYNKTQIDKGMSLSEALDKTEKAVKKAFPDKFTKNKERQQAPPIVEGPTHEQGKGNKFTVTRLSAEQKRVYDQMVTRHKILSHDEYFKSLETIGELA
jgi:hypothetical protein